CKTTVEGSTIRDIGTWDWRSAAARWKAPVRAWWPHAANRPACGTGPVAAPKGSYDCEQPCKPGNLTTSGPHPKNKLPKNLPQSSSRTPHSAAPCLEPP